MCVWGLMASKKGRERREREGGDKEKSREKKKRGVESFLLPSKAIWREAERAARLARSQRAHRTDRMSADGGKNVGYNRD